MLTFSFIIPVKPGIIVKALTALRQLDAGVFPHEILIVEGRQPSRQRNIAACEAKGDILYFLDDDSLITVTGLAHCAATLNDTSVAVVGGPSLTPPTDSRLQKLFGRALSSLFGAGGIRNRYRVTGISRVTTEKELILCNMAIRRNVFVGSGGLNERLYPNEENELLDRVAAAGHKIMHIPAMAIYRSQRLSLKAFVRQIFSYGRGRAQQTIIAGFSSLSSFVPMMFVLYLLSIPFLPSSVFWKLPLILYVVLDLVATCAVILHTKEPYHVLLSMIFPLMHCSNGCGLMYGFLGGKPKLQPGGDEVVRRVMEIVHVDR